MPLQRHKESSRFGGVEVPFHRISIQLTGDSLFPQNPILHDRNLGQTPNSPLSCTASTAHEEEELQWRIPTLSSMFNKGKKGKEKKEE